VPSDAPGNQFLRSVTGERQRAFAHNLHGVLRVIAPAISHAGQARDESGDAALRFAQSPRLLPLALRRPQCGFPQPGYPETGQ
jgi:hypothetical protein